MHSSLTSDEIPDVEVPNDFLFQIQSLVRSDVVHEVLELEQDIAGLGNSSNLSK